MSNVLLYSELFGTLFLVGNALTNRANQHLRQARISVVQWQLCAALSQQPRRKANLSTLASLLSTSRQNIKQVARGLVERGWITMEKDPKDSRSLVLAETAECRSFWDHRASQDLGFLESAFGDFTEAQLRPTKDVLKAFYQKWSQESV